MGEKLKITINSIENGLQSRDDFPGANQFMNAKSIDLDFVGQDNATGLPRKSGLLSPIAFKDYSSATVDAPPLDFVTGFEVDPENLFYTVLENGKFLSYEINNVIGTITDETLIATLPDAGIDTYDVGGIAYYDNYIYLMGTGTNNVDVSRYGPLSGGSPTLTNGVWTGATLGSQPNLQGSSLPRINGVYMPQHWGHVHVDDALYFADSKAAPRRGVVSKIKTIDGTDDGSSSNVLDLPQGHSITDIDSYGNDLVIAASLVNKNAGSNPDTDIGPSSLFFWDTISDSFCKQVKLPEFSYVSAIYNKGGTIYVFGGSIRGGHSIGVYDNADGVSIIRRYPNGNPPFPGAIDSISDRITWGTTDRLTDNSSADTAVLYALGSEESTSPSNATHSIGATSADVSVITAFKYFPLGVGNGQTKYVFGGNDSIEGFGDVFSDTVDSRVEFGNFSINQPFKISKVKIPRSGSIRNLSGSQVTITPKFYFDDKMDSYTLDTIDSTNFESETMVAVYKQPELTDLDNNIAAQGKQNFSFEIGFSGSGTPISVKFPIEIELETIDD